MFLPIELLSADTVLHALRIEFFLASSKCSVELVDTVTMMMIRPANSVHVSHQRLIRLLNATNVVFQLLASPFEILKLSFARATALDLCIAFVVFVTDALGSLD